jgi:hypothetical protein
MTGTYREENILDDKCARFVHQQPKSTTVQRFHELDRSTQNQQQ